MIPIQIQNHRPKPRLQRTIAGSGENIKHSVGDAETRTSAKSRSLVAPETSDEVQARLNTISRPHNERTLPRDDAGQGSNVQLYVDAMERCGNRRPQVERLVSAWNQGSDGQTEPAGEPEGPLVEAAIEPRRRARTRLTTEEVDAIRTARANGVGVTMLAKQFGVHRATVWAKTR